MKAPLYLGVDLGGTNIKAGLVDHKGNIISEAACPTLPERGQKEVISDLVALCFETIAAAGKTKARAAGVGVPGVVNAYNGAVLTAPNLFWKDVALGPLLEELLQCPAALDNDANTAAMAEYAAGAAKGYSDALVVTLGTGVGAGVIVNGRLLRGAHGLAGEIGHMTLYTDGILCNCKNRGCFEMYASARALRSMGMRAVEEEPACMLARAVSGEKELVTAELVARCAQKGDAQSLFIWERYTGDLALGLSNAARVMDPQIIVIGGGVANAGEFLLAPLREKIGRLSIDDTAGPVEIACARFGAQAGIIGAAMLARSLFDG
ncbi:MAG: ROK family protein [Bacillota bacterium]